MEQAPGIDFHFWIQVATSIVGIAIAITVPAMQNQRNARTAREAVAQKLRANNQIIKNGLLICEEAHQSLIGPRDPRTYLANLYDPSRFNAARELIKEIDVHNLPSPNAVVAVISSQRAMLVFENYVRVVWDMEGRHEDWAVNDDIVARIDSSFLELVAAVDAIDSESDTIQRGRPSVIRVRWGRLIHHAP